MAQTLIFSTLPHKVVYSDSAFVAARRMSPDRSFTDADFIRTETEFSLQADQTIETRAEVPVRKCPHLKQTKPIPLRRRGTSYLVILLLILNI